KRYTEATLERLGNDRRKTCSVTADGNLEFARPDQFLPILLDHVFTFSVARLCRTSAPHPPHGENLGGNIRAARRSARKKSHATPLSRPTTVMRNRCNVTN